MRFLVALEVRERNPLLLLGVMLLCQVSGINKLDQITALVDYRDEPYDITSLQDFFTFSLYTKSLRLKYAIIKLIYRNNHPPFPLNCYRTHSPKL